MLANDARILIRSAAATAIAGITLIVVSALIGGEKGALGAACGVALVAIFFSLSVVAVSLAGRWGSAAMMGTALGTYVLKILAVLVLVAALRTTTLFNTRLFGITAVICILTWSGGQIAALARRRVPYVVPETPGLPVLPPAPPVTTAPEAPPADARGVSTVAKESQTGGEP
jgi:ATP synthase protein I